MFPLKNNFILLPVYISYVHSLARTWDRQKWDNSLMRPRYHDAYVKCPQEICDKVDVYPETIILEILSNKKELRRFFGTVLNSSYLLDTTDNRDNIYYGPRKHLCLTEGPIVHAPKVMRNINKEWKFIVNVKGYAQTFTSEICRSYPITGTSEGRSDICSEFKSACTRNNCRMATCKQFHQEIFLMTFEDGMMEFDKFNIPTTCNCC